MVPVWRRLTEDRGGETDDFGFLILDFGFWIDD
jgi:hypothetical protein